MMYARFKRLKCFNERGKDTRNGCFDNKSANQVK